LSIVELLAKLSWTRTFRVAQLAERRLSFAKGYVEALNSDPKLYLCMAN
jgi:hypothetical protein